MVDNGTWTIGEERELKPGRYVKAVDLLEGWVLWAFEDRNGRELAASKGGIGEPHPLPLGIGSAMFSLVPALRVAVDERHVRCFVFCNVVHFKAEIRLPGQRFYSPFKQGVDLTALDGATVELTTSGSNSERITAKISETQSRVDLTGLRSVIDRARSELSGNALPTPV